MCVQGYDHWPTNGKNNPRPCMQITCLICVCLTVRGRGVESISCQVIIWPDIIDRDLILHYKQVSDLSALSETEDVFMTLIRLFFLCLLFGLNVFILLQLSSHN